MGSRQWSPLPSMFSDSLATNKAWHARFSVLIIALPVCVGDERGDCFTFCFGSAFPCCFLCFKDPLILHDLPGHNNPPPCSHCWGGRWLSWVVKVSAETCPFSCGNMLFYFYPYTPQECLSVYSSLLLGYLVCSLLRRYLSAPASHHVMNACSCSFFAPSN